MAHSAKEHNVEHDHSSDHGHGKSHDAHHEDHHHGGHHHQTRHYTDQERNLYGLPKNTWDECTDSYIEFSNCVRNRSRSGILQYIWTVHWSDRWICQNEQHAFKECKVQRMLRIFDENKEEIAARS